MRFFNPNSIIRIFLLSLAILVCLFSYVLANNEWTNDASILSQIGLGSLTVLQYLILTMIMFIYWWITPDIRSWRDYKWLIVVAVVIRLLLIPIDSYTSNDVDRYLFDGKVTLSGFDPYRTTHDDPQLDELKKDWYTPVEHAKYPTLYPPGAIALFSAAAASGPEHAYGVWKTLTGLAGIAIVLLMLPVLSRFSSLRHFPLIALSPLLIFEIGIGGHIDAISSFAMVAALFYWQRERLIYCGILIGIGALIKLLPLLLLFPLCFSAKNLKHFFILGVSAVVTLLSGYLIAILFNMQPIGSTPVFFEKWRNAAPLFEVLNTFSSGKSLFWIIIFIALIGFTLVAIFSFLTRQYLFKNERVVAMMQWSLAIPLLLSPVVFPWYVLPLIIIFALRPSFFLIAWISVLPITYIVLDEFACCGVWATADWPVFLLGFALVGGLVADQLICGASCSRSLNNQDLSLSHPSIPPTQEKVFP